MAARLCDATGLVAEQRAEGLALVDETGELTDVAMPAEGTEAHATLLVAEYLAPAMQTAPGAMRAAAAAGQRAPADRRASRTSSPSLRDAKERYGRYWRKSAREPGAERELAQIALERLEKLQLVVRHDGSVRPLPALARFALGEAEVREPGKRAAPRPPPAARCSTPP